MSLQSYAPHSVDAFWNIDFLPNIIDKLCVLFSVFTVEDASHGIADKADI